jgi:flagellar motor protein MotB
MPSSERQNALEDLVARMNNQTIGFGFRKIEPDSRGEKILQSYAKGMSLLPEYTLRIEGHSNLAKSESKLTAEDQARIQKLSEDRAEACAGFLKAAGVQNEITCVGQGALKGETKGCVRLVLVQKSPTPQVAQAFEQPQNAQEEASLSKKQLDSIDGTAVTDSTHDTAAEEVFLVMTEGTDNQALPEVLPERSAAEEGAKPSEPKEADATSMISKQAPQKDSLQDGTKPDAAMAPPSSAPDESDQWGNTYLPWYITCCSHKAKPQTDECPMQGLPVKQMQLLQ